VLHVSYDGWGAVHLELSGVLAILAGYALMAAKTWARVYAVILAMLSATRTSSHLGVSVWESS